MSRAAISRGKEIIKEAIRSAQPGELIQIPAADEANLAVFRQALRSHDIQRMLIQKNITIRFHIPPSAVDQAKNYMLEMITATSEEVEQIVFPVLPQDYSDAEVALASPEIQAALQQRGITASLQVHGGEIVIGTIDQLIGGDA